MTGFVASLVLTACGSGGPRQDAQEPKGKFPVTVAAATFPASQALSEHTRLTIAVRNAGHKTIPDIAVTICNQTCGQPDLPSQATYSQAFSENIHQPYLADPSRPIWVVDRPPGVCSYSCQGGGQGAAVTDYNGTWALGPLRPGKTARFTWGVTAVRPGHHVVAWEVAAGLNGRARAVLSGGGGLAHGSFAVAVAGKPNQSYVNNAGQIVTGSGQP